MVVKKNVVIKLIIVVALAIASGCFLGIFYVNSCASGSSADLMPSEMEIRDEMNVVLSKILKINSKNIDLNSKTPYQYIKTSGKKVEDISGIDNYIIAESKLFNPTTTVKKTTTGFVKAMGVNQTLKAVRFCKDKNYFCEEVSESSFVKVASKFYYTKDSDNVQVFAGSIENGKGVYKANPTQKYSYNEFREDYGLGPDFFLDYIVSSLSVEKETYDGFKDGFHNYNLDLKINMCEKNYMYKIKKTANSNSFPAFKSVKIQYSIDDDWNIHSVKHFESYGVYMPMLGKVDSVSEILDVFEYGVDFEIPKI